MGLADRMTEKFERARATQSQTGWTTPDHLAPEKAWAGTGTTNRYAGTVPGSGGQIPLTDANRPWTDSSIGSTPMTFTEAVGGFNDFVNNDWKANAGRSIPGGSAQDDLAVNLYPPTSGSSGGSAGGSSGGGGAAGPTPQQAAAYRQVLAEMGANPAVGEAYDAYEGRLGKAYDGAWIDRAYDPGRINQIYDTARGGVQDASAAGLARLGPILQGLRDRAATARTGANDAFARSDARLAALDAQYGARAGAATQGLNNILGANDAGEVAATETPMDALFANARIGNERFRGVTDVGLADRPAVYEGLNADVQSGISRDEAGLLNRIAMQRAGSLNQNEQGRQQALGSNNTALQTALAQAGVGRLTAEQEERARLQDLKLRMAELGIDVPGLEA